MRKESDTRYNEWHILKNFTFLPPCVCKRLMSVLYVVCVQVTHGNFDATDLLCSLVSPYMQNATYDRLPRLNILSNTPTQCLRDRCLIHKEHFHRRLLHEQHPCTQISLTHTYTPPVHPTSHTPIYPLEDEDVAGILPPMTDYWRNEWTNNECHETPKDTETRLTRKKYHWRTYSFCHPFHVETDNNSNNNNTHTTTYTLSHHLSWLRFLSFLSFRISRR